MGEATRPYGPGAGLVCSQTVTVDSVRLRPGWGSFVPGANPWPRMDRAFFLFGAVNCPRMNRRRGWNKTVDCSRMRLMLSLGHDQPTVRAMENCADFPCRFANCYEDISSAISRTLPDEPTVNCPDVARTLLGCFAAIAGGRCAGYCVAR